MTKVIDLKSLLIGGLLALLVLCVLGATPRLLSPGPVGRYALVATRADNSDDYVIDTITGQVWSRYARGEGTAFYDPKLKVRAAAEPNRPGTR